MVILTFICLFFCCCLDVLVHFSVLCGVVNVTCIRLSSVEKNGWKQDVVHVHIGIFGACNCYHSTLLIKDHSFHVVLETQQFDRQTRYLSVNYRYRNCAPLPCRGKRWKLGPILFILWEKFGVFEFSVKCAFLLFAFLP